MNKRLIAALVGAGALAVTTVTAGVQGADAASPRLTHISGLHAQRVCAKPAAGHAACMSKVMVNSKGVKPMATFPLSTALSPDQIRHAYNLVNSNSGGRTVAIVDAYGYPNLERDLTIYRNFYNLPACTTANGCLKIVNQSGNASPLPATDLGWSQEQALDVDAVSAACPDCKILVVQSNSASFADLGTAVNAAAGAGVVAISNSYGGGDAPDSTYGKYYNHSGIAVTASTGDNGYKGASYPASSHYVTAVGGTSLKMSSTTRVSETVWSGAGSGCSSYNAAITAASPFGTGCAGRAMADVSAAADPNTGGLSVYAPTSNTASTWSQYGGTSESSPIIASVYALAGGGYSNATPYGHPTNLFDITSGSNSKRKCPATQWCTAGTGWDGPTGLGTPNGTGAF